MRRLVVTAVAAVSLLLVACGSDVPRAEIEAAVGAGGDATPVASPGRTDDGAVAAPASSGGPNAPAVTTPGSSGGGAGAPVVTTPGGAPVATTAPAGGGGGAAPRRCADPCAPLVIGSVGTWSGIAGQNVVGGLDALRAWVASVNANGGIGGHQVRLEVADDGADPQRHRALIQEMVEQRGVVAFIYNAAVFSGQASVAYLEQHRIPVVGGSGTEPWYATSPMFFSQVIAGDVAVEATVASYARSAQALGITRLGLVTCAEGVQVCVDTARLVPGYAQRYGLQLAYQGQASLAAPDFTANCLAARNADVQLIYVALDANSYQRFGRSCASIGYRPRFGIAQPVMLNELAGDPNLDGSPGISYTAPYFYAENPAIAEFQATMADFAPRTALTGSASLGWSAAKLLEAASTNLSDTPTSNDILEGLWALDGTDLGGLTFPLRYQRDAPTVPPVCYWQVTVAGGHFQSPDGGQRHCEGG